LLGFPGVILVVSHDRYFLDRVCDRVLVFEDHGQLHLQEGNYSYYLEKNAPRLSAVKTRGNVSPKDPGFVKQVAYAKPKKRRLSYKEEREWEGMDTQILALEEEINQLEEQLNNPDFYSSRVADIPAIIANLSLKKSKLLSFYARWAELDAMKQAST
jgi:ABC transport system ATP-binding/permease protein